MNDTQQYDVITQKNEGNESHEAIELKYGVLESVINVEDQPRKVYGLCITKNSSSVCLEESEIYDVCCSKEEATILAEKLAQNKVLPLHLHEVVQDYLDK